MVKQTQEKLPNGLIRYFHPDTDGGGEWMKTHFIKFIKAHGQKEIYDRCYEWCSGSAPIGFTLLDLGLIKHLTCHDSYDVAINDSLTTIKMNNIENKVDAFISSTVSDLPKTQPWDLVVSNPPHCWEIPEIDRQKWIDNPYHPRILLDQDKQTHQEFFDNILERITADCDIFVCEQQDSKDFIPIAEDAGLKFIDMYQYDNSELYGPKDENRLDSAGRPFYLTWDLMHFRPQ